LQKRELISGGLSNSVLRRACPGVLLCASL